jgi:predicted O-linked N-acetylglucosamine transferase (SPINDLY family)
VNKVTEALGLLAEVSAREPNQYLSFAYQGQILFELKKYLESLKFFDSVLKIDNNLAEAWSYRALNFLELERNPEALFAFQKATQLEPKNDSHWANLAVYFVRNNDKQKAIECFERCAEICPGLGNYLGALLHMKKFCADWKGYEDLVKRIKQGITQNLLVTYQFDLLSISDSEEELKFNAITNARTLSAPTLPPAIFPKKPNANKIKIGYLCGEYRNHAIAVCLVGVLENHHRDQFEILGFDYTPDDGSEVRQRILKAFDSVHNIEDVFFFK